MARPRTDYIAQSKECEMCGATYYRKTREYSGVWAKRKYCSWACSQKSQRDTVRTGIRNRVGPAPRGPDIEERLVNLTEFGGYNCPLGGSVWDRFGRVMGA